MAKPKDRYQTQFFGVVIELLQIDDSNPAYDFKPVVFPNEWQKSKRHQASGSISVRGDAYKAYFQLLIDELREKYKFTSSRVAQPQCWYAFASGASGIAITAAFTRGEKAQVELYIDLGGYEKNKALFNWLLNQKDIIENECGSKL